MRIRRVDFAGLIDNSANSFSVNIEACCLTLICLQAFETSGESGTQRPHPKFGASRPWREELKLRPVVPEKNGKFVEGGLV